MSYYCNIYRAGPGVVTFGVYNLLGHIDGHIDVWLRTEDFKWVVSKTGNYANLTSIRPEDNPVVWVPDEKDTALLWPYIVKQVRATCDCGGRFILPEDQAKADAEQREFDESPPDSWQRVMRAGRQLNIYGIPWGAHHVMAGCPIIENRQLASDDPMRLLTDCALELLANIPVTEPEEKSMHNLTITGRFPLGGFEWKWHTEACENEFEGDTSVAVYVTHPGNGRRELAGYTSDLTEEPETIAREFAEHELEP